MTAKVSVQGVILNDDITLSIHEFCEVCGISESVVIEMVYEGVAEPIDISADTLEFSGIAVTRLLTAQRLQRDLRVNLPGAALALELLDEISALRRARKP